VEVVHKTAHKLRDSSPKQEEFCELLKSQRQVVALFGGAGGTGKSYCARTACLDILGTLAGLGIKGQRVTLSCSTYDLLRDRHISKFPVEFEGMGEYRESHKIHGRSFVFNDRNLGVIALRNLDDPNKYRGTECIASLVDELTEVPEEVGGVRAMDALLYPIRTIRYMPFLPFGGFTNPDGVGFQWVRRLFVDRDVDYFGLTQEQVHFLPARIEDNPKATVEMYARLDALQGNLYKSRRLGLWDAPEGARWPMLNRQKHLFKMSEVWPHGLPAKAYLFMGVDWGKHAPYGALWFAFWDGAIWCYREDYMPGLATSVQADRVANLTGGNETIQIARFDPSMWADPMSDGEYSGGPPKISYFRDKLVPDPRFLQIAKGFNRSRSQALEVYDHLFNQDNDYPNLFIEESCLNFWRELSGAVWDTRGYLSGKKEDLDPRSPDHLITAGYYALFAYLHPESVTDEPNPLIIDWAKIKREQEEKRTNDSFKRLSKQNSLWRR
jgi:hypothetical protein